MEKQYRPSLLRWIGSILIALLIIGSLGFGAYRLYALGWEKGAAAVQDGSLNETPRVPAVQPYHYHRMGYSPILLFFLTLIVIGAIFRHSAWRMHTMRSGWRHGPASWVWHCHNPECPDCEDTPSEKSKAEDKVEGTA